MVVIAISGMPGAGTSTIARNLAKRLKLKYFSPGEYFKAETAGNGQAERALKVWRTKKGSSKDFHEEIDGMQRDLARKGSVVICGKLSVYVLKDVVDWKIWVDCSLDERAKRTADRDDISVADARKKLVEREGVESERWKEIYGIDRESQSRIADLRIDTTFLSVEESVKKIIDYVRENSR